MSRNARSRGRKIASPPETADIAVSLARIGWPVFPVSIYEDETGRRHKVPAVPWKDAATTDAEQVAKWWAGEHSGRWIGVYAEKAGILIGDLDPAKRDPKTNEMRLSGAESIAAKGLELPDTFSYPTHRKGGMHYVYAAPPGVEVTIGSDIPAPDGTKLHGVDVRAGSGLVVYYGPALKKAPKLAPAPDWLIVTRNAPRYNGGVDRVTSAAEPEFMARLVPGDAPKKLRKLVRSVEFPSGAAHEPMLEVVAALISEGAKGTPGIAALLEETRERYVGNHPDRPRDWDNAVTGSVRRFGLPAVTLELTKAERKTIKKRNEPEEIERRKKAEAREYVASKIEALAETAAPDDISDDAMAERFAEEVRGVWAHSSSAGLLRYNGVIWERADEALLIERARIFCRTWRHEMKALAIRRGDKPLEAAAVRLGLKSVIGSVARLAAGILLEDNPALDRDPDLLNCPNGVVDLRTGEIRERRWDDYFTKVTAVEYIPDATSADWDAAQKAIPKKTRPWFQVRMGQAATGRISLDKSVPFCIGGGDNGKSAVLGSIRAALGTYAVTVPDSLLLGADGSHPTELMTLRGARLAVFEELPRGGRINAQRMKLLSGTSEITARFMGKDFVTFPTTHTLVGATNHLPVISDVDDAIWKRVAPVPFPFKFIDEAVDGKAKGKMQRAGDPGLRDRLAEYPQAAVLAWLVAGAVRSYKGMLPKPAAVQAALDEWRGDSDPVLAFVKERLVRDEGAVIAAADLYAEFGAFLEKRGQARWSDALMAVSLSGHSALEGVTKKQLRITGRIFVSRPLYTVTPIPARPTVWQGIRFATDEHVPSEAERDAETMAHFERQMRK